MKKLLLIFLCSTLEVRIAQASEADPRETGAAEIRKFTDKLEKLNGGLKTTGPEDMSCLCKFGDDSNVLRFEKSAECGPDRNYFEDSIQQLKKIDSLASYTSTRSNKESEALPRKCSLYIMKSFFKDRALTASDKRDFDIEFNKSLPEGQEPRVVKELSEYKNDPHIFSKCGKPEYAPGGEGQADKLISWEPIRYPHKACMTEDYVNLVHNSLLDVGDCLGLPLKVMAPKFANESGLHPNAFALGGDGGIGQFTSQALTDVNQNYQRIRRQIDTKKPSCQRLAAIPGAFPSSAEEFHAPFNKRCSLIATPPNPMKSLVAYGIFFRALKSQADNSWNRKPAGMKSVEDLLAEAGVPKNKYEKLKEMLFIMSYNAGPGSPPVYLREWLKYRIEQQKSYPLSDIDFDTNFWPERGFSALKEGNERVQAIMKTRKFSERKRPLTMPEYLFAHHKSVYIAAVRAQSKKIERALGQGVCTEKEFLEY